MRSRGSVIRSAKMNATTPPNEIPPFQSAAARGTLPIEQTKLITATKGPTTTFSTLVQGPWPRRKTTFQRWAGTNVARKPATTKPMASSRRNMVRSAIV
jgi:hypothetical protein